MLRALYTALVLLLAALLFSVLLIPVLNGTAEAPSSLVPLFTAALVFLFPSFSRSPVKGMSFWLLYVTVFEVAATSGQNGSFRLAYPLGIAALILASVAAFGLLWHESRHDIGAKTAVLIAALLGIGIGIAVFSSPAGGAGRFMAFLLQVLHLPQATAETVNFLARKSVHLTAYGGLALAASGVARTQGANGWRTVAAGYLWALAHAVYDEVNQRGIPGRTGSAWDVGLDFVGMTVFLAPQMVSAFKGRSR